MPRHRTPKPDAIPMTAQGRLTEPFGPGPGLEAVLGAKLLGLGPAGVGLLGKAGRGGLGVQAVMAAASAVVGGLFVVEGVGLFPAGRSPLATGAAIRGCRAIGSEGSGRGA
jgi:hypothetical protein